MPFALNSGNFEFNQHRKREQGVVDSEGESLRCLVIGALFNKVHILVVVLVEGELTHRSGAVAGMNT